MRLQSMTRGPNVALQGDNNEKVGNNSYWNLTSSICPMFFWTLGIKLLFPVLFYRSLNIDSRPTLPHFGDDTLAMGKSWPNFLRFEVGLKYS